MSDFYYGQGKLYLARRNTAGQALSWRWVGDVSSLELEIEFDDKQSKASVGGTLVTAQRYITALNGKINSTWHEFSTENLKAVLGSGVQEIHPNLIYEEILHEGIIAGDVISLKNPNVWGVSIANLTQGIHFSVDPLWGSIKFFETPAQQPVKVEYEHAGSTSLPFFLNKPEEYSLRYTGENLAEKNKQILVEIYRVSIDPLSKLSLINNESELGGLETSSIMLYDHMKREDPELGHFGRIVVFNRLNGLLHDGTILHNGIFKHEG